MNTGDKIQTLHSEEGPLVSIIVITYNSSQFVLETLESVRAQTYRNIELIITDDGSTDNTVSVCREWLESKKERFVSTKLLFILMNSGIPSNCNRGVSVAKGKWVKLIAGDDLLDRICIERFMTWITNENQYIHLICCNKVVMREASQYNKSLIAPHPLNPDQKKQLIDYACKRPNIAPFVMISKYLLLKFGGFDESYRLLEDAPFFFKALKNGYRFSIIPEDLVYYRVLEQSASNSSIINPLLRKDLNRFLRKDILPYFLSKGLIFNFLRILTEMTFHKWVAKTILIKIINKGVIIENKILYGKNNN